MFQSEIQRTRTLGEIGPKCHPFGYFAGVTQQTWELTLRKQCQQQMTPITRTEENPSAKNAQDSKDISCTCFSSLSIYLNERIIYN